MKTTFDARFKKARGNAGLTQGQLAKKIAEKTGEKTTQTTISDIETGKQQSATFTATAAHICGVDAFWLETGKGTMLNDAGNVSPISQNTISEVPLISWVQAGDWANVIDNLHPSDSEEMVGTGYYKPKRYTYALRVRGAS
ncbi:MAG: helix-turn-helix domain-containing protein, partial [Burkholderiales bacterium]|nr:helix-turn-helix domain-containing protein [Burkholderiales bacterium]